jgi:hypothetical protein
VKNLRSGKRNPGKSAVGKAPDQAKRPAGAPGTAAIQVTKQVAQEVWKNTEREDTQLPPMDGKLPPWTFWIVLRCRVLSADNLKNAN